MPRSEWRWFLLLFSFRFITLVLLRWFEMHMERGRVPFDPNDHHRDYSRHLDRKPRDKTVPKVTYDPIADAQLKRLQDRRRKIIPDSGERAARKSD